MERKGGGGRTTERRKEEQWKEKEEKDGGVANYFHMVSYVIITATDLFHPHVCNNVMVSLK